MAVTEQDVEALLAEPQAPTQSPPQSQGVTEDEVASIFEDDERVKDDQVRQLFETTTGPGVQFNVDKQARVLGLMRKMPHVPSDVIEQNADEFEGTWELSNFDPRKWRKDNPDLARIALENPKAGRIIMKDGELSVFSKALNKALDIGQAIDSAQNRFADAVLYGDAPESTRKTIEEARQHAAEDLESHRVLPGHQTVLQDARTEALQDPNSVHGGAISRAIIIPAQRYEESARQMELSKKYAALARARSLNELTHDQSDHIYETLKEIHDIERDIVPLDLNEGSVEQVLADTAQAVASQAAVIEPLVKGAGAGAGLGALGGALLTRSPAGAIEGAKVGARLGGDVGAFWGSLELEQGGLYRDLLDATLDSGRKVTEEEARGASYIYGIVAAGIEVGALESAVHGFKGLTSAVKAGAGAEVKSAAVRELLKDQGFRNLAKQAAKAWAKGAASEGIDEVAQSVAEDLTSYIARSQADEQPQSGQVVDVEKALLSGQKGFEGGGAMSVPGVGLSVSIGMAQRESVQRAGAQVKTLASFGPEKSPSVAAAPEAVAALVEAQTRKAGEPVTHLYVDTNEFTKLFQGPDEAKEAAKQILGEDGPKKLQEAQATGSKLEIPVATYLSKVGGTDLATKLEEHTTTRPDRPTIAEQKAKDEEFQKTVEAIVKENEGADSKGGRVVAVDELEQQLVATNKFTRSEVSASLAPLRAAISTLAKRMGKPAEEVFKNYGISVSADGVEVRPIGMSGVVQEEAKTPEQLNAEEEVRIAAQIPVDESAPTASQHLTRSFLAKPKEKRSRLFYTDPTTGALNASAFRRIPANGRQVAIISVEGVKHRNDKAGHEAGNDVYRAAVQAVHPHAAEVAKVGGDLAVYVKDQAELDDILAKANQDRGLKGYTLSGAVNDNPLTSGVEEAVRAAAAKNNETKKAAEESGKRAKRGERPLGAVDDVGPKAGKLENVAISADLEKAFQDLSDEQAFNELYIEESTGLLTKAGFEATPAMPFMATIDVNGLKELNARFSEAGGDLVLQRFGDEMVRAGGQRFFAAHISGDEYALKAATERELQEFLVELLDETGAAIVEFKSEDQDGNVRFHEIHGVTFAWGVDQNVDAAEAKLNLHKQRLSEAGLRGEGATADRVVQGRGRDEGQGLEAHRDGPSLEGRQFFAQQDPEVSAYRAQQKLQPALTREVFTKTLDDARAWIGRMKNEERKAHASAWVEYLAGKGKRPTDIPQSVKNDVANKFGLADPGGHFVDAAGRSLERPASSAGATRGPRGEQPDDLKKYREDGDPETYSQGAWTIERLNQSPNGLDQLRDEAKADGLALDVYERNGIISLQRIVVPEEKRKGGIGTRWMERLVAYADQTGQTITLSPSVDFGASSRSRLVKFYKRFGFVENKGRAKDFSLSESMYRLPQQAEQAGRKVTRTPEFKAWFKDSRVVQEDGAPRIVFHGSNYSGFDEFKRDLQDPNSLYGPGFYTTEDPEIASTYVDKTARLAEQKGASPGVYPLFLSIQNPLDASADARSLIPALKRGVAKFAARDAPPANIKRMIDTALRDEAENFSIEGLGVWVDNTEWAYNIADAAGKNGEELLAPHFDYVLTKAVAHIIKQIQAGELKTGDDVVQFVRRNVFERMQNNDSNIRDVLEMLGFDGITHIGGNIMGDGHEHRVWIAFHPEQVKSAIGNRGTFDPSDPNILNQGSDSAKADDASRGFVVIRKHPQTGASSFRIVLNPRADRSTFLHETGHVFLEMLKDIASRADAPEQIRKDWGLAREYMGLQPDETIEAKHHEKFAEAFEQYLYEGKAPSEKLRRVFARFRTWLVRIYKGVFRREDLSDEMRGVFDRLLATDEEIERAQNRNPPTSPDAAELFGIKPEEMPDYLQEQADAVSHARQASDVAVLKEQQRELDKEWKEELATEKDQAADEYEQQPARVAQRYLRGEDPLIGQPISLDRGMVEAAVGPEKSRRFLARKKDGISPDVVAELFRFPTGKAMLEAILALPEKQAFVEEAADARMKEKHGDLLQERERLREIVGKGLHGRFTLQWLFRELKALHAKALIAKDGQVVPAPPPMEAILQAATVLAERRLLNGITPGRALQAERRAADRALKAAAKGDFAEAFVAKKQQLLNAALYAELLRAREDRDDLLEFASDLSKPKNRAKMGKVSPIYRDGLDVILEGLGLKSPDAGREGALPSVREVVARMEADGASVMFDVDALGALLANPPAPDRHPSAKTDPSVWQGLTVGQVRMVLDALKNIQGVARAVGKVIIDGKREDRQTVIANLLVEAAVNMPSLGPQASSASAETWWQRLKGGLAGIDGSMLKPETMLNWLGAGDTNSFWYRAVVEPLQLAKQREADLLKKTIKPLLDAFAKMPKDRMMERVDGRALFPSHRSELEAPTRRFELLMMALNSGNESNLQRLLVGRNITPAQLEAALATLTKQEWDWVQSVWDSMESLWPEAAALEERDSGLRPPKIKPLPVQTPHGTYRGGYFPAIYDRRVEIAGEKQAAETVAELLDKSFTRPGTAHGHLKSRVKFAGVLSLEPSAVPRHLAQVAHDISFREAVKSVGGLILNPDIQRTLKQHLGDKRTKQFLQWLKDIGTMRGVGDSAATSDAMRVVRAIRANSIMAALGYSLPTALGDFSNLVAAVPATELKSKHMAAGLMEYMRAPNEARATAESLSGELRFRRDHLQRELTAQVRDLTAKGPLSIGALSWLKDHAFAFMEWSDIATSTPVWIGLFRQAVAEGQSEKDAVRFADSRLRQAFPSHNAVDAAGVLRDKGFIGTSLMLYGYFNTTYNVYRNILNEFHTAEDKVDAAKAAPRVMGRVLAFALATSAMGEALSGRGPEDDEEWQTWLFRKIMGGWASSIPYVGDVWAASESLAKHRRPNPRAAPTVAVAVDLATAISKLGGSKKTATDKAEALLRALGPLLGLPINRPLRSVRYLTDVATGDEEPTGPLDAASGVVYGKRR